MVDEVLSSDSAVRARFIPGHDDNGGHVAVPHGFSIRQSPAGLAGHRHDVLPLEGGRIGVLLCCCDGEARADEVHSAARAALLETADPVLTVGRTKGSAVSVVCAVIDGSTIGYSSHGDSYTAVAAPESETQILNHSDGRLAVAELTPGATVLMATRPIGPAATALDGCGDVHPDDVADQVVARVDAAPGFAAVVYRHPPKALTVTLPAEPAGLAVSRGLLRQWLVSAGVDSESAADVLLAAGEATANATEHAVVGASRDVEITVTASLTGSRLRLTVSDTGVWKPASLSPGHRGHGLHLINALVDSAELTTTPEGTIVAMLKELRP